MAEADATAAADALAAQLSGLFRELAEGRAFSAAAGVSLADAPARGRAERLYLFQCDSDDLTLVSTFRRWWGADAAGFRWLERWPLTQALVGHLRWVWP